jgi:hypothetical protein
LCSIITLLTAQAIVASVGRRPVDQSARRRRRRKEQEMRDSEIHQKRERKRIDQPLQKKNEMKQSLGRSKRKKRKRKTIIVSTRVRNPIIALLVACSYYCTCSRVPYSTGTTLGWTESSSFLLMRVAGSY